MAWRKYLRDLWRGYSNEDVRCFERRRLSANRSGQTAALTKREARMLRHKRRQWRRFAGAE